MAKILIAGICGGIGHALFDRLVHSGEEHEIYAIGHNAVKMQELQAAEPKLKYVQVCDFTHPENLESELEPLWEQGPFDAFCYCSGMTRIESVRKIDYQSSLELFNVNFFAMTLVLKQLIRHKPRSLTCRVALLSSIAAKVGSDHSGMYAASKAAMDLFVKANARELLTYNVSINTLQPSYVDTPMLQVFGGIGDVAEFKKGNQTYGLIKPDETAVELEYMLTSMPLCVTGSSRVMSAGIVA